jgi:hypothetical protein
MQIRPVSTFSAFAAGPHTMRMCSCNACASLASPPARPSIKAAEAKGVQRSVDGDSFIESKEGRERKAAGSSTELSDEDRDKVRELEIRDREVRAHENAHKAAAGGLARGGPNYKFQSGPDGKQYAVGGDVQIDTSPGRTPEETIAKAQRIRAAGLAPAEPSGADRAVVAQAAQMEMAARAEKSKQNGAGPATRGETLDVMA